VHDLFDFLKSFDHEAIVANSRFKELWHHVENPTDREALFVSDALCKVNGVIVDCALVSRHPHHNTPSIGVQIRIVLGVCQQARSSYIECIGRKRYRASGSARKNLFRVLIIAEIAFTASFG
jgi:hypothetical protein